MRKLGIRIIRKEGDEILKKKSKTVKEITPSILELLDDMQATLRSLDAVGIAAPQVGVLKRICIVEAEDELYELINPQIISHSGTQTSNEACLSVPGRSGNVERPLEITVTALNRDGEEYTIEADDFLTTVLCHELDHLDGVLFIEKATNIQEITNEELNARKQERRNRSRERGNRSRAYSRERGRLR